VAELTQLLATWPALNALPLSEQTPLDELLRSEMVVPAGQLLFSAGERCQGLPLVLAGEVQVTQHCADGRLLELYRVLPGELCLMSSASLFRGQTLLASGRSTCETRLCVVPPEWFMRWLALPGFRAEVLALFAERMSELVALIDAIAFQRLDQRLAAALLGHGAVLSLTHQALADQLGTVREIVTRLLRRFEREAWVALSRERIEILNAHALRQLAAGAG
jgi:CRP/FNR family transcriptional regulator